MSEVDKPDSKKKIIINALASFPSFLRDHKGSHKKISAINVPGMEKMDAPDRKRRKVVLIGVSSVVVLLGIILGSYFSFIKSDSPKSSQGLTATKDWVNYKDDRGFTLQMPKDWKVSVNDWGLIKIGPNPEKTDGQTVFALTMVYPQDKTKQEVLADIKTQFEKSFSNFQIIDQKNADKYSSIITRIKYTGSDMRGVLNINGDGKNYFVSGFAAPSDQLKDAMPNLMKVLASFNYDAKLRDPDKISGLVKMIPLKDPTEGAFTIDVPTGWKIDAGVVRPYIDAALKIIATSGDMGVPGLKPIPPHYTYTSTHI